MDRDIECAWAAGFFDGEGNTCTFAKGTSRSIQCSVSQVNRENLERFLVVSGVGNISNPRFLPGRKPISKYAAYGVGVQQCLRQLWPYLGEEKKIQALRALISFSFRRAPKEAVFATGRCLRGHAITPSDIYTDRDGGRECMHCRKLRRNGPLAKPDWALAHELRIGIREYVPPEMKS